MKNKTKLRSRGLKEEKGREKVVLPSLMSAVVLRYRKITGLGLPLEIRKEEDVFEAGGNRIPKAKGKMPRNLGYEVPTGGQGGFGTLSGVRLVDGVLCLA